MLIVINSQFLLEYVLISYLKISLYNKIGFSTEIIFFNCPNYNCFNWLIDRNSGGILPDILFENKNLNKK